MTAFKTLETLADSLMGMPEQKFINCTRGPVHIVDENNQLKVTYEPSGMLIELVDSLESTYGDLSLVDFAVIRDFRIRQLPVDLSAKVYYIVTREIALFATAHNFCFPYARASASGQGVQRVAYRGLGVVSR